MFNVISLFSLINDDVKIKKGRLIILPQNFENQLGTVVMPYAAIIETDED